MKYAAVFIYALLLLICGVFVYGSYVGNQQAGADFDWRPDDIAYSFVPVTLFAASAMAFQLLRPFSVWLLVGTIVVGTTLLIAALYHTFPTTRSIAAWIHVVAAAVLSTVNVVTCLRSSRRN